MTHEEMENTLKYVIFIKENVMGQLKCKDAQLMQMGTARSSSQHYQSFPTCIHGRDSTHAIRGEIAELIIKIDPDTYSI